MITLSETTEQLARVLANGRAAPLMRSSNKHWRIAHT